MELPSIKNFASLLRNSQTLEQGRGFHAQIIRHGLHNNTFLANLLVQMYGRFAEMDSAASVFQSIPQRNLFSWTILLTAFSQNGDFEEALRVFREMNSHGVKADRIAIVNVLGVCSSLRSLAEGRWIHSLAVEVGLEADGLVSNSLISMYGRCGSVQDARTTFDRRRVPSAGGDADNLIVAWNSMIKAYVENDRFEESIELYESIAGSSSGICPDAITFSTVLAVCSRTRNLALGKAVHSEIEISGLESNTVVANSLLTMYGKCESLEDARRIFESIRQRHDLPIETLGSKLRKHKREILHWNAMISAYAQNSREKDAIQLYKLMLCDGITPDLITLVTATGACSCSSRFLRDGRALHSHLRECGLLDSREASATLIHMYGDLGRTDEAGAVFDSTSKCLVSYNAMITAYAQAGHCAKALALFQQMDNEGVRMDKVTYISILNTCSRSELGEWIYARACDLGLDSDPVLGTAAISMFGRCGSIGRSRDCFLRLRSRANVVSWTALIAANAQNGHWREALEVYQSAEYRDFVPDRVTFVCVVEACAELGALKEGREIQMRARSLGLDTDTVLGNAIVQMFAKCGSLGEAIDAFARIPRKSVISWNAMAKAMAQSGDFRAAIGRAEEMSLEGVDLDESSVIGVLFACSHAGLVDRAWQCFVSIGPDFGLLPSVEHFVCMVDVLGRSGKILEAEELLESMPFQADRIALTTLLCSKKP